MREQAWFENHWRRILVDMHIPDWDDTFLSKLTPERYVELMERAGATSAMVYANSHVGVCTYPTRVGKMHSGLQGRDFFGETVSLCHKRGITVCAYYSLIHNNWAYIEHPDWRILQRGRQQTGRYGLCCPNSPYRQFALEQTAEICRSYDCDGIFFDMTFWVGVCYCHYCIERYRKEAGAEPPRVVDWNSPGWLRFQEARERWLKEFAAVTTGQVKSVRPGMTSTHQSSTVLADCYAAVPFSITEDCDYLAGDFYGEMIQQSVVCKMFTNLSTKRPFEFHTSVCLDLTDHETLKTPERLASQAFVATAHSSAFCFIDAIDPDGSLNEGRYARIRKVFDQMAPYEPELGGELLADVAVYYSDKSRYDPVDSGVDLAQATPVGRSAPHRDAMTGACHSLQAAHIPFTVVTKKNLNALGKYQVLVLPDVLAMDTEEADAVRKFVSAGGGLYASHRTSLAAGDGEASGRFLLGDVLGASVAGKVQKGLSFFTGAENRFRDWIAPQKHMIHAGGYVPIAARSGEVLATVTLPYTDPQKGQILGPTFSSIHSNPPGLPGREPGIVLGKFGKGRVCYCAAAIEAIGYDVSQKVFANLVRLLLTGPTWFEAAAHASIEVVLTHQPERKRALASILNSQYHVSGAPASAELRIRIPDGMKPVRVVRLPEKATLEHRVKEGYVSVSTEGIETFQLLAVEWQ